ncbi:ABC transporter ATP-binding protein [Chryseolinea sp. T2]|uniref:ABC transporter ATP-binding protein n=1 Tax=Chryseolinea sp. T2 TaxID=3129255 RepID=UPI0030786804
MSKDNTPHDKGLFAIAFKAIGFAWRTDRKTFLLLILLNVFNGSIVYLQFTSFSAIVDDIIAIKQGTSTMNDLIRSAVILGLSFLVPTLLANLVGFLRTKFRMAQDLYLDMYRVDKQSALDIGTIESSSYQNLLRSAHEWGTNSILGLQDFVFTSASSFAGIFTSMIILWSLSPWLVLFAALAAAPIYFFYKKYSMEVFRIRWLSIEDYRVISNRLSHFEEMQKAVDLILLKLKDWFRGQIYDRLSNYNSKVIRAERKKSLSYGVLSLWYLLFLFAAIALMTKQSLTGSIAVGALLLAFNTYTRFYQTVNGYIESISITEESSRYAARWFDLFALEPKLTSSPNAMRVKFEQPPRVEFRNVSFRYPGEDAESPLVVKNISFTISPGEKIAIIGVNGSGKTTLIKLLCRTYDPTEGQILVNGVDLKDINLRDWQSAIGVLFQDFPLYHLTIRESIGLGNILTPVDESKMAEAARYSGADEFIETFPRKFDQLIWKEFREGTDLSKGQHQRLAVARMFYRNAAITILDEPTASIDAVTEEKIFSSLEENMEGKTVILITHRFSSVKNADKILMLEQGHIIEQGSHKELMALNKKYAALYTMQASRYLQEDES